VFLIDLWFLGYFNKTNETKQAFEHRLKRWGTYTGSTRHQQECKYRHELGIRKNDQTEFEALKQTNKRETQKNAIILTLRLPRAV
jgi:hypothetical protein